MGVGEILGWVGTVLDLFGIRNVLLASAIIGLVIATYHKIQNRG